MSEYMAQLDLKLYHKSKPFGFKTFREFKTILNLLSMLSGNCQAGP